AEAGGDGIGPEYHVGSLGAQEDARVVGAPVEVEEAELALALAGAVSRGDWQRDGGLQALEDIPLEDGIADQLDEVVRVVGPHLLGDNDPRVVQGRVGD